MGKSVISSRSSEASPISKTDRNNKPNHSKRSSDKLSNVIVLNPGSRKKPRKFETTDNIIDERKNSKITSNLGENIYNGTPAGTRKDSSQSNFMFNPIRQDSIGSLLNNYSTTNSGLLNQGVNINSSKDPNQQLMAYQKSQSIDSNFPSYYLNNSDNQSMAGTSNSVGDANKQKSDNIYLPPPISTQMRPNNEYDNNASYPSRSDSIFSSLIQMPGSNGNSISGISSGYNNKYPSTLQNSAGGINNLGKSRQLSSFLSGQDQISLENLENLLNKESLGNLLAWQQQQQPQTDDQKNPQIKQKGDSIDLLSWENNILPGSISGFSGSLSDILAGISNGSIDFSNMSTEQRRDSILKIFNDSQNAKQARTASSSSTGGTKLREDIFDKSKQQTEFGGHQKGNDNLTVGDKKDKVSTASSISSRTSAQYNDEPQSPKTSPSNFHSRLNQPSDLNSVNTASNIGTSPQSQMSQRVFQGYQQPMTYRYSDYPIPISQSSNNLSPNTIGRNAQSQYGQPIVQSYSQQPYVQGNYIPSTQPTQQHIPNKQNTNDDNNPLVSVQQYIKSEDGRPLLGATKIDQLMLVIQARDKGITNQIPQASDGSLLATSDVKSDKGLLPQPISLVGGVDKPNKVKDGDDDDSDTEDKRNKKKKMKNQQCPFCFKYFTQSTHLEVHVRSHIGYKPFECSYCQKRFTQGGNLRTHLRLHTGEKPFECEICNRSFSRKGNLAAHRLTHENLKPYECRLDGCDKSFTQLGNLKSHQNRFHLATLNEMTQKLAELDGEAIKNLPPNEKSLLNYFKDLYKNSNKGIRGRGRRIATTHEPASGQVQPVGQTVNPNIQGQFTQSLPVGQQQVNYMNDVAYKTSNPLNET